MPASAYMTMVQIPIDLARAGVAPDDSFAALTLSSIAPDAIADSSLAEQLQQGDVYGFLAGLQALLSEDDLGRSATLETLDVTAETLGEEDTLKRLVGCALRSGSVKEAQDYWNSGSQPGDNEREVVDFVLQADVLAEYSKAKQETFEQTALKVAGKVAVGAMVAGVGVIEAAGVTGVVVAIVGVGGVALVGIGAGYIAYRLFTRRRRLAT